MAAFVEQVRPRYGVFTMGYHNRFGHPHPQVVARFRDQNARILRSDTGGLISLAFGDGGVVASEYRPLYRRYWQADYLND
jgi:competence protein ComEC